MIVHVIDDLLPESGGPTTVVVELARQQSRAGLAVGVVCRRTPPGGVESASLKAAWSGTPVRFARVPDAGDLRTSILEVLRQWQPRVLHLHAVWERIVLEAAGCAEELGIPWVLSTHGMLHPTALRKGRLKKWVYLRIRGKHVRQAREVLALNSEEAAFIKSRYNPSSAVLANGIEVSRYQQRAESGLETLFPELKGQRGILYMGRLHPIKGVDQLLRSFAIAAQRGLPHHLWIVGPDGGVASELRELAQSLGITSRAHFLGPLFGTAKLAAFQSCEIFAHRPRFEGFGLTIVEAMAAGKPVVTTQACKLDGAGASGALHLAPDDDEGFARALQEVGLDQGLRERLGSAAGEWSASHYDWSRVAIAASESYERAVRRP